MLVTGIIKEGYQCVDVCCVSVCCASVVRLLCLCAVMRADEEEERKKGRDSIITYLVCSGLVLCNIVGKSGLHIEVWMLIWLQLTTPLRGGSKQNCSPGDCITIQCLQVRIILPAHTLDSVFPFIVFLSYRHHTPTLVSILSPHYCMYSHQR